MNPLGDTLVILSLICFAFALACVVADWLEEHCGDGND